jgi:esterase
VQIQNGQLNLHVSEDGDSTAPPILLLHGITGSAATWDWIVPTLAERFRVLRLDFRGHGKSDRAPGDYGSRGYVSDAVAALEQAAGQPCPVIGHSLGGVTAAALTQRHATLLTAAVLEDPPLGLGANASRALDGNSLLDGFRLMRESIPQLQASGIALDVLVGVLAASPDTTGESTFGAKLHPDAIETMAMSLLDVDATVLDPVVNPEPGASFEPFLDDGAPFGVPTLIVTADPSKPDAVASPAIADRFASISAAVEVVTAQGAGHLVHSELVSRAWFRDATMAFLDRVAPAR